MLLTGTFPRTVDDKQRLAIPKRLRDALTVSDVSLSQSGVGAAPQTIEGTSDESSSPCVLYAAPGTDGSLALYTEESFARLGAQLAASPPTGQDVRAFSRLFYSQAERLELDRQGRIRIPVELAKLANIQKEVVLVGVGDHLELWDKGRWEAYVEQQQAQYDQLAERAFQSRPTSS